MGNHSLSHYKWDDSTILIFIPEYRKKALYGKIKDDIRKIIRTL